MKKAYLILSAIFLFNPIISIIDIFPDFIGYLLLLKAFSALSYIDDLVDDLCNSLKKMTLITLIKFVCLLIVPSLDKTMYLVFSFVFAILEIIFGVHMLTKLFDALSSIAINNVGNANSDVALKTIRYANNEKIRIFTIVAFVARLCLASLPDFTLLSISNGVDTQTGINYAQFRPIFIVISSTASLIIGVIWLIKIIKYYDGILTKDVLSSLKNQFDEKAKGREALFMARDCMLFLTILCIGSLFSIDFNLNLVNILWDSIFSIMTVLAFVYLIVKKHFNLYPYFISITILSVLHLASDICLFIFSTKFFDRYNLDSVLKVSDAEDMYFVLLVFAIISALLFVGVVTLSYIAVRKSAVNALMENAVRFSGTNFENCVLEFKKKTKTGLVLVSVFSALSSIAYVCYMFFRHSVYVLTLVNSIFEIIFIVVFVKCVLYIYDNVYKRIYSNS